ncbi:MAG: alternative oxidase [bacterium]|nr:alternative oxidase [bacterium]
MNEELKHSEELVRSLNDANLRAEYAAPYDHYLPTGIARVLGSILIHSGTLVYGRKPSYEKFKAIEVIARIPYQSWEVAAYTILTALYTNEKRAIELTKLSVFSREAQDNETMHVVVISQIVKRLRCQNFFRHTLIPFLFAFFYFWIVYILFLISRRSALDLNYLFESHAYSQYQKFLDIEGERLKQTPITSDFLAFYGRDVRNEYEFFELVRNDELVHRNRSARGAEASSNSRTY